MRYPRLAIVLQIVCACAEGPSREPAVRLATGASDTIVINSRWPSALPVHALDARGRIVAGAPIRFTWANGAELPVTNGGAVTCTTSGDLGVRAVLDSLTIHVFVRCRPVDQVHIQGPIQFVLGDPELSRAQSLSVGAYGADRRPVAPFNAAIGLVDSDVASLDGTTLTPRSRGKTIVWAHIGDRDGQTGVHIYQRVETLDALDTLLRIHPDQRFFAIPLRLESGRQIRHPLPPGHWMLSLLPREHLLNRIRVGVNSAACESGILNEPGRLGCETGSHSSIVIYRQAGASETAPAHAYLLIGWSSFPEPRRFVSRVPAMAGSLGCVQRRLGEQGYVVQQRYGDRLLLRAEPRDARLGTDARREWIEIQVATTDATLRGRAWAVDSYPAFEGESQTENPLIVEPDEVTLVHAREAMRACGRSG